MMGAGSVIRRTHWCGDVNEGCLTATVAIQGWVNRVRDHGGVIFIDVRDRSGILQVVMNPDDMSLYREAIHRLRSEFVVAVEGGIVRRPEGTVNDQIPTGRVEMRAARLEIINSSEPPVFPIEDDLEVDEALRLTYRYLDLRRPLMQRRLMTRHQMMRHIRSYLDDRGFIEIETPMLTRSTPEGARDYLVPSRVNPGTFFALPQSPQLFKQLLMISGLERYYQIARCFRDEDLRADRQPEFTQLDLEMSFVAEEDVMGLMEELILGLFDTVGGVKTHGPVPRMTYQESMDRYGVDNPDLRYGLEIFDFTEASAGCGFQVFRKTAEGGGVVRGIRLPGGAELSRSEFDALTAKAVEWGAAGLAWMKLQQEWTGPIAKFLTPAEGEELRRVSGAEPGDAVFFAADKFGVVCTVLGRLRQHLAREKGLIPQGAFRFVWITDFPLVQWDEGEKRFAAVHHPFTAPNPADIALLDSDPGKVRARAYDLVLNGQEIGGGSIRIHDPELQKRMFAILGIDGDAAEAKFGFLLTAFRFGAPPHGGIAMGLDRIAAIITGSTSIREVIAFPKTQKATCLLTGAPTPVAPDQLRDLHVRSTAPRPEEGK
jgi:aspartyl-tRNA synthetase